LPLVTDETHETDEADETDATATPAPTAPPAPPGPAATEGRAGSPSEPPAPHRPSGAINQGPVEYKGQPLDAERGPGLGCFRIQLVVLVILILLTPLSVGKVPDVVTALLLFATIALLLVSGQTIIFLLRLVAADRRGRRQPLAARTPTVGQLEDVPAGDVTAPRGTAAAGEMTAPGEATGPDDRPAAPGSPPPGPVRQ
jgi:hypothetical protein